MKRKRLEEILDSLHNKRVAVIGDVMLDIFRYGPDERLSPEEPGTVIINEERREEKLGGAGNVASNIISLGGECYLFGIIGNDYYGKTLRGLAEREHINAILLNDDRKTTVKERIIATREKIKRQVIRIDNEDTYNLNENTAYDIVKNLRNNFNGINGIILQDYGKGLLTDYLTENIVEIAKESNIPLFVDPKRKIIINSTIFKPNKKELFYFSGVKNIEEGCRVLFDKIKTRYLVVTASDEGMYIYSKKDGLKKVPTVCREVVDVMGAGDSVIASLALAYISSGDIYDACDIANHAAGVVVGKVGTATVNIDEIKKSFLYNNI